MSAPLWISLPVHSASLQRKRHSLKAVLTLRTPKRPRQESNLILDLRRVACDPPHPKDKSQISNTPPGNRTQSDGLKVRYADHHTGEVLLEFKMPHRGVEPRLTASNAVVRPSHSQGLQLEQKDAKSAKENLRALPVSLRALCDLLFKFVQSRRQDSHLHPLVYETSAF